MSERARLARTAAFVLALTSASPARAGDPERGLALSEEWCNSCHVVHQSDPGWHSGNVAPRFSLLTKIRPEAFRKLLRNGHGDIPAIRTLPEKDYDDMIAHIDRLEPEEQ